MHDVKIWQGICLGAAPSLPGTPLAEKGYVGNPADAFPQEILMNQQNQGNNQQQGGQNPTQGGQPGGQGKPQRSDQQEQANQGQRQQGNQDKSNKVNQPGQNQSDSDSTKRDQQQR